MKRTPPSVHGVSDRLDRPPIFARPSVGDGLEGSHEWREAQGRLDSLLAAYEIARRQDGPSSTDPAVSGREYPSDVEDLGVFEAGEVPAVVLDEALRIFAFTPSLASVFNIRPQDIGRPLSDLTSRLPLPSFLEDIATAFETGVCTDREVRQESAAARYIVRSSPRRGRGQGIEAVVICFMSIARPSPTPAETPVNVAELHHRVRNMLMVAIGIAQQTYRASTNPEVFLAAFTGRMRAMARAYDLLSRDDGLEPALETLVRVQLSRFDASRVTIVGPVVGLTPEVVLCLGLVLHELVTNALKHGALSTPEGRISISWSRTAVGKGADLTLRWIETGGPAIMGAVQRGFGLSFVEQEVAYNLGGNAKLEFLPRGLEARMTFPLVQS